MTNKTQILTVRGKTSYAKILGDPVLNYDKSGKEWKMDLQITKDTIKELKGAGIGDRVKTKDSYLDGEPYISFKQAEFTKFGKAADPIKVVDIAGRAWDQSKLIGNGSDVDVKFAVVDFGPGKKKGAYIRAVRVLNLVPYEGDSGSFEAVQEDDEFYDAFANAQEMVEAGGAEPRDALDELLDDDVDEVI